MTVVRDVERILERWLVDGIDEMPDRVFLSILDRVERQPRQRAWRVSWRNSTVNGYLKPILALAAVAVLAVGGIAFVARPTGPDVGGTTASSPSPSAVRSVAPTPTPVPSPPALPTGLLEARDYVGRALPGDSTSFIVAAPAGWSGLGGWALSSPARSGPPSGIGIAFLHGPQVVDDPCSPGGQAPSPEPSPPSVDGLVAALSARRDLQVSGVTDTVLAGFAGKRLDLQLPASLACAKHYVFAEPQGLYAHGPANRWRVWMLDAGGDPAVVVLMDFAGTTAADRADAQGAIDSVRITP